MDLGLKGKTALVTGASEGIGRAIAQKLAEEGVRVAICARTASKLQETAAAIVRDTGMEIVPIPADLRSLAGCEGFVEQAAARSRDVIGRHPWPTHQHHPVGPSGHGRGHCRRRVLPGVRTGKLREWRRVGGRREQVARDLAEAWS